MAKCLCESAAVATVTGRVGMKARSVARGLARALISAAPRRYLGFLADDAILRMWRWDGVESHGGNVLVAERLAEEAASWVEPRIDVTAPLADGGREVVELVVTTGPAMARLAHQRCLVVTAANGRAREIDLYCAVPTAAGMAAGQAARASWSDDELDRLLAGGGTELRDATVGGGSCGGRPTWPTSVTSRPTRPSTWSTAPTSRRPRRTGASTSSSPGIAIAGADSPGE